MEIGDWIYVFSGSKQTVGISSTSAVYESYQYHEPLPRDPRLHS